MNTNFFYEYKLFLDVDFQGRISDRGVFQNSAFNKVLERDILNLPDPAPLPTSTDPTWLHDRMKHFSYVFVADEPFPLGKHCMKPYLRPILVIENANLITGYQGFSESVKVYLVFGAANFVCSQLQWCFHQKGLSP